MRTGDDIFGCVTKSNDTTAEITEPPVHKYTHNYKSELESMIGEKGDGVIKVCPTFLSPTNFFDSKRYVGLQAHHDNTYVHFVITVSERPERRRSWASYSSSS